MKLFVDDYRATPSGWTRAYTAPQAIAVLESGVVDEISLNYDLGCAPGAGTGIDVLRWISGRAVSDPEFPVPKIQVHSEFPPISEKLMREIEEARK